MNKKYLISFVLLCLLLTISADTRPKIGLVLSGGGAKGIAHIGVLKVLEEYGIKPDYIAGTSMGAIIGALYSIGYSAAELDSLIFSQNWASLMTDRKERINLSLLELETDGKYQLNFPMNRGRIGLPSGLVNGQNIINLLSSLTIPAHNIDDFHDLPVPFCCIGTDLETGNEVVMDHGILSEAIRGSMSIPTVFTPSEWENTLLLDGGLVNNFPVEAVRKMGAEIIIGVDISQSIAKREDLKNMVSVITQAISFRGYASTEEQRHYCDILITPNLEDYNLLSFDKLRDIFNIGEYAARQAVPEIQALASIMKDYSRKPVNQPIRFQNEFFIRKITVNGLKSIQSSTVKGWLNISTPSVTDVTTIENSIQRLISSRNFEFVHYRLLNRNEGDGYVLELNLKEKSNDTLFLGGNFNTEDYASILMKLSFQNTFRPGTSFNFDARLNPKAEIDINHRFLSGWDYGVGVYSGVSLHISELFKYREHERYEDSKLISNLGLEIGPTLLIGNKAMFSLLYRHDIYMIQNNIKESSFGIDDQTDKVYLILHRDFLDDRFYPSKGGWGYLILENSTGNGLNSPLHEHVQRFILNSEKAIPISKHLSIRNSLNLGISSENNERVNNSFFLGGNRLIDHTTFPFPAMRTKAMKGCNAYVLKTGLQYKLNMFFYLSLNGYYAEVKDDIHDLFSREDAIYGSSIDLGIRTMLGPVDLSLQKNNHNNELTGYFNIGYRY
jgi:NTE family protein